MISIATNVAENDDARIATTVPHWLRTFGDLVSEIVIVVDRQARTSRMADERHQVQSSARSTLETVRELAEKDRRIKFVTIDAETDRRAVSRVWFKRGQPLRCQVGSPLFGYVLAIESATNEIVIKMDCDMLFHDNGWGRRLGRALEAGGADVVEPSRSLTPKPEIPEVSTRVFAVNKKSLRERVLPIKAHRLDWPRRIHRRLHGRPTWVPLEQMLTVEIRANRLRYEMLPATLGFSLHVPKREDFLLPGFDSVVSRVEAGDLPLRQQSSWNFAAEYWR